MQKVVWLVMVSLWLVGCNVVEQRLREPAQPTGTPIPFSTATPGGKISVWIIPPTELAAIGSPVAGDTSQGEIVGPAATATAAVERILAATQTAAAPTPQPTFQPNDCPATRGLSAPAQPNDFTQYSAAIGVFLSNGGASSVLESTLRTWGAITDQGGAVQADTDLTGDKIPEIIVNVFNPQTYNPEAILNSGQLLIFGCDNQGYRLLFNSPNSSGIALPVLHRVGDMNGDVKAEVVYDTQSCTTAYCLREGSILTWNTTTGAFEPLNNQPIEAINGRLGVADVDADGILELSVISSAPTSLSSGPTRSYVDVWDWSGQNYLLATRTIDDPRYRIHQLHDADEDFLAGNYRSALRGYFEVLNDRELLPWTVPNETQLLRAMATYRIVVTYARIGDNRAEEYLGRLLSENPEGSPTVGFALIGQAFMESVRSGAGVTAACQAVLGSQRSEILAFLNSYGTANRSYTFSEICPF